MTLISASCTTISTINQLNQLPYPQRIINDFDENGLLLNDDKERMRITAKLEVSLSLYMQHKHYNLLYHIYTQLRFADKCAIKNKNQFFHFIHQKNKKQ